MKLKITRQEKKLSNGATKTEYLSTFVPENYLEKTLIQFVGSSKLNSSGTSREEAIKNAGINFDSYCRNFKQLETETLDFNLNDSYLLDKTNCSINNWFIGKYILIDVDRKIYGKVTRIHFRDNDPTVNIYFTDGLNESRMYQCGSIKEFEELFDKNSLRDNQIQLTLSGDYIKREDDLN